MALDLPSGWQRRWPHSFHENLAVLAEASHAAPGRADLSETFAGALAEALSADLVLILECYPEDGSFVLRAGRGFPEEIYGRARVPGGLLSQAGRAMLDPQGQPVVLEDFSKPHDWADEQLIVAHGARSGIAVKVRKGLQDYGALCVFSTKPREYDPEEVDFLRRAAAFLGGGLERLQRHEAAVAWRSRAELLRAGAALVRIVATRDELLTVAALSAVSGGAGGARPIADWCFADALEANGTRPKIGRIAVDHAAGVPPHIKQALSAPLSPTAPHGTPRAYATRQPELLDHINGGFSSAIARDPDHRQAIEEAQPLSYVCAPVIGREHFYGALGFLRVASGITETYNEADLATCSEFATLVGSAIDAGLPKLDIEEARDAVRAHSSPAETVLSDPSGKERDVLELIAKGMNKKEISSTLRMAYSTVRTHRQHLCQKLGLLPNSSDITIIAEAHRCGWLTP